ncbi:hypothetical protein V5F53_21470 [Xanthobacter sp. V4C-4]|uniref:hypothetical protein n=1 Tax=Xanthobacter cornucopiae TaxID=3119924 RepID=UPI003729521B
MAGLHKSVEQNVRNIPYRVNIGVALLCQLVPRLYFAGWPMPPASRENAEKPTNPPPAIQKICRQMSDGTPSLVTPRTSA